MLGVISRMFRRPDPLAPLKALLPELTDLQQQMEYAEHCISCPLDRIVFFLDIVSKWHDRGSDDIIEPLEAAGPRYAEVRSLVSLLHAYIWIAGRNQFGMNRTQPGEEVTVDNVFLGDVWGIRMKPVRYWRHYEYDADDLPNHQHPQGLTVSKCIKEQAHNITESRIKGICESIEALRTALASEHQPQT